MIHLRSDPDKNVITLNSAFSVFVSTWLKFYHDPKLLYAFWMSFFSNPAIMTTITFDLTPSPPPQDDCEPLMRRNWLLPPISNRGFRKDLILHVPFPFSLWSYHFLVVCMQFPTNDGRHDIPLRAIVPKQHLPVRVVCTEWRNVCDVWQFENPIIQWGGCVQRVLRADWVISRGHGNAEDRVKVDRSFGIESRRLRLDLSVGYYYASGAVKRYQRVKLQTKTDSSA